MIYLVSGNRRLFESENYEILSPVAAVDIINSWELTQFDSETSGRDAHICNILCIQFGNRAADTQIVVDTTTVDINLFRDILENKLLIGHNLKFDIQFLYRHAIIPKKVYDTMVVEQFLFLGYDNKYFHYSLQAVGERRLKIDIDKSTRGEIIWRGLDDKVILYAAGDVVHLEDIRDQQLAECKATNRLTGAELENMFVPVIAYLEWCGIRLDVDKWQVKMRDNEAKRDEALNLVNDWVVDYYLNNNGNGGYIEKEYVIMHKHKDGSCEFFDPPKLEEYVTPETRQVSDGYIKVIKLRQKFPYVTVNRQGSLFDGFDLKPKCNINWDSSRQTIPFFQMLGFNTQTQDKKSGENKDSVVEKVLAKQKGIADDFLKLYFMYKEKSKDCSTYGQNYIDAINPITGRIHTSFWQLGAVSGRMSCGSKNNNTDLAHFKKISPSRCKYVQLQNLPSDEITRSSFIPNEGNLMTSCDYSALESRLGADIYQDQEMLKEFLKGSGDMHSLCAKLVFHDELEGIEVKDIKKLRPDLRKKVKPIEFSQQFGGGPRAVADALGCSTAEAKKFVKAYADGFKGVSAFKEKGSRFVRKNGYIIICKYTGHRLLWQDHAKWREIEDVPEQIRVREYSDHELREHDGAAAKWDRAALNVVTQGTGIIILKYAMTMFFKWIIENNLFEKVLICDLVHDEAVIEYPEDMRDVVESKLVKAMEKAASVFCKSLPIPAEPATGLHWIH